MGIACRWSSTHPHRSRDGLVNRKGAAMMDPASHGRRPWVARSLVASSNGDSRWATALNARYVLSPLRGFLLAGLIFFQNSDPILTQIHIDQKLNEQIDPNITFTDESGTTVKLGDYFRNKPIILTP